MLVDTKEALARIVAERFAQASPSEGRRNARKLLLELIQAGAIDLHAARCEVPDYPVFPPTDGAPAPHLLDGWDELAEVHAAYVILRHADDIDFETGALSTLPLDTRRIEGWPYPWRGRCVVVRLGGLMIDADELDEALVGIVGEEGTRVEASPSAVASSADRKSGGRPPKHDWIGAMAHMVAVANMPDGISEMSQGDIARRMVEWLAMQNPSEHPAEDQAKIYARKVWRALHPDRKKGQKGF